MPGRWASRSSVAEQIFLESLSTHEKETVLLSLGSNIEPLHHLLTAARRLADAVQIVAASGIYETTPVGDSAGPVFLNAALEIRCGVGPGSLKHRVLRPLEESLGRVRSADRNAPRTIDIDISLFGQRVLDDPAAGLEIPDPEILTRAHVAIPLANVAPTVLHPVVGLALGVIAGRFGDSGVDACPGLVLWPQSDRL